MLRVIVAAHLRLHRDGIASALSAKGHRVVAAVASPAQAVRHAGLSGVDIAVVDLPRADCIALVSALRRAAPVVKAVAVGIDEVDEDVLALVEAGAAGYLPREGSSQQLVATVERAARGESLCSPAMTSALMARLATLGEPRADGPSELTARERQVTHLLAQGLSNKEIAVRLCIEVSTVKNHVHRILGKLDARRRGEVVARLGVPR
jgi:two-component system nitrate/nitrite response regulator NarL